MLPQTPPRTRQGKPKPSQTDPVSVIIFSASRIQPRIQSRCLRVETFNQLHMLMSVIVGPHYSIFTPQYLRTPISRAPVGLGNRVKRRGVRVWVSRVAVLREMEWNSQFQICGLEAHRMGPSHFPCNSPRMDVALQSLTVLVFVFAYSVIRSAAENVVDAFRTKLENEFGRCNIARSSESRYNPPPRRTSWTLPW